MATQIAERAFEYFVTTQQHYLFLFIDGDGSVFHQRIQDVNGHALISIPIPRSVLNPSENEWFQV